MSALDEVINTCRDQYYQPTQELQDQARAELAALRAEVTALQQALEKSHDAERYWQQEAQHNLDEANRMRELVTP